MKELRTHTLRSRYLEVVTIQFGNTSNVFFKVYKSVFFPFNIVIRVCKRINFVKQEISALLCVCQNVFNLFEKTILQNPMRTSSNVYKDIGSDVYSLPNCFSLMAINRTFVHSFKDAFAICQTSYFGFCV